MHPTAASEFCRILGSNISVLNCDEVVVKLRDFADQKQRAYVCVSNVHTTVMGWQDKAMRDATNGADLATPDGMPLVWVSRFLGPRIHGRASGPDIMMQFLQTDEHRKYRHFFFGSTEDVLEKLVTQIQSRWPGTQIAGTFSPPFKALSAEEETKHAELINSTNADIVWVGLGAPKQELWMRRMRPQLDSAVLIGVGAAYDFIAGTKPRAPVWMQNAGLEWFFRLASEPRRLFRRYAVTNTLFVIGVVMQILRERFTGASGSSERT